jgi:hypothetical protein
MKITRNLLFLVVGIILLASFLFWLIPWLDHGGWPSSGAVGNALPPNIEHVMPVDGEILELSYGFCVHYNYLSGNGMSEKAQKTPRYFFDGRDVTQHMYEIVELEYPTQIAEPCYKLSEPIRPGWHTAKVTYEDNPGTLYEYKWRFQVLDDE